MPQSISTTHHAIADAADFGQRLDKFLCAKLPEFSRARLQQLIAQSMVAGPDGKILADAAHKIKMAGAFTLAVPPARLYDLQPEAIALDVKYEDADLLVVNKPAGLVVHPAAGNYTGTLVQALLAHCGASLSGIGGEMRPGIVHRLDKDTSGLLVVAKNDFTHQQLSAQFAAHSIRRLYQAWVFGVPQPPRGEIRGPIGRSQHNRQKMAVRKQGGKEAITHYRVLAAYARWASHIECRLETGRTHQIRVHLSHLGHGLIGDKTYGGKRALSGIDIATGQYLQSFPRQALHAGVLGFIHPRHQAWLEFSQELPADLQMLAAKLREIG